VNFVVNTIFIQALAYENTPALLSHFIEIIPFCAALKSWAGMPSKPPVKWQDMTDDSNPRIFWHDYRKVFFYMIKKSC
jgi:hypothetical protein